jgi:hypothetical protein
MKTQTYNTEEMEVAYSYFRSKFLRGTLKEGFKDDFLSHREQWDSLQELVNSSGRNMLHDDIKGLVRYMDKGGYLGGLMGGETFEERNKIVETKKHNLKEFGCANGIEGIESEMESWADKSNSPLADYYNTPGWQQRSLDYRRSKKWVCELCLKDHSESHHTLHTHHRTYKLIDGSSAIHRETERELMALCDKPCHVMADVARMVRDGKYLADNVAKTMDLFTKY